MNEKKKRPKPRNHKPDLDEIVSATEYTGAVPARNADELQDPEEE